VSERARNDPFASVIPTTQTPDAPTLCSRDHLQSWELVFKFYGRQTSNTHFLVNYRLLFDDHGQGLTDLWSEFCFGDGSPRNEMWLLGGSAFQVGMWVDLYERNEFIMPRFGETESQFINCFHFGMCQGNSFTSSWDNHASRLFRLTGLYNTNASKKIDTLGWLVHHSLHVLRVMTAPGSCLMFLHYDLVLWAQVGYTGPFLNWGEEGLVDMVFQHSDQKNILFLGQATESVKAGYENLREYYRYDVSNFTMCFVNVPQTTPGYKMPHNSSLETTQRIMENIRTTCPNFDTVLLACGSYSFPLMSSIYTTYGKKNMLQMSSAIYSMFGLQTKSGPPAENGRTRREKAVYVKEKHNTNEGIGLNSEIGANSDRYFGRK